MREIRQRLHQLRLEGERNLLLEVAADIRGRSHRVQRLNRTEDGVRGFADLVQRLQQASQVEEQRAVVLQHLEIFFLRGGRRDDVEKDDNDVRVDGIDVGRHRLQDAVGLGFKFLRQVCEKVPVDDPEIL